MPKPHISLGRRLIQWRFLLTVNFVFVLFLGVTLGRQYVRSYEIQKEIDKLTTQAEELSARNISLAQLQTAVQTESFIEREARLKLGLKKPGEEVVIIQEFVPPHREQSLQNASGNEEDPLNFVLNPTAPTPQVANVTKWWYYFFDKPRFKQL